MISEVTIEAKPRTVLGKGAARRMRREGSIPVTMYGGETTEALSLSVNGRQLLDIFRSATGINTIFQLKSDGETTPVLIKDWQADPVTGALLHADFIRIDMSKITRVRVPIEIQGEPTLVKSQGGMVEFVTHHLEIECLPSDIPPRIHIDVSNLQVGERISVKDLNLSEDLKMVDDPDRVVVLGAAPRVEETPETTEAGPEAEAETGEPEKKEDEE